MNSKYNEISNRNMKFWNELCGTHLAREIGITDHSKESLEKYDKWYMRFYPYLNKHIPFCDMKDRDVLEVGLGYGTVAQKIIESGAKYNGLDIAEGPVNMVNHRIVQFELKGKARQGDILKPPFDSNSFDYIISIGCLHHTGNLKKAINNCHTLLRPGGKFIFMIYYAYSLRRFLRSTVATIRYAINEMSGYRGVLGKSEEEERIQYDLNSNGAGAPYTDWISVKSVKYLCDEFSCIKYSIENFDSNLFNIIPRSFILKTKIPSVFGLDLYVTVIK